MKRFSLRIVVALALMVSLSSVSFAQTTGNQSFNVTVPVKLSITAPAAASITHDETDNPNAFPAQAWVVKGNASNGLNVSFATSSPFVHSVDATFKRNAKLDLALGSTQGPANWTIGTATDTTNYVGSDNVATVTASSNGIGRANLNLTVSFITEEFGVFAAGTYATTVTGTVGGN